MFHRNAHEHLPDGWEQILVLADDVLKEGSLEFGDLARLHLVQVSSHTSVNDGHLLLNGHGSLRQNSTDTLQTCSLQVNLYSSALTVLALLEQLCESHASVQQLLCGSIQIRTELSEGGHLTVLGQLQLHGTSHLENKHGFF